MKLDKIENEPARYDANFSQPIGSTPNRLEWGAWLGLSAAIGPRSSDFRIYDGSPMTDRRKPFHARPLQASSDVSAARFFVVIPCAGKGGRALVSAHDNPDASALQSAKQYREIAGQSVLAHTLDAFKRVSRVTQILVVVAPGDTTFENAEPTFFKPVRCGGVNRAESVLNGLHVLQANGAAAHDWVLVHDAARCLITPAQINQLIDACENDAVGGLLAHKVPDTLKTASAGRVAGTVDRSDKWLAQTPQMFRIGPLSMALAGADDTVTDESSAMEAQGFKPKLVTGSAENFKVTYPEDFQLAEAILLGRSSVMAAREDI